jgi:signal transduction histidine kinase
MMRIHCSLVCSRKSSRVSHDWTPLFEPFFTTKPTDRGTGLGLSVSYFIITENHGGEMSVNSAPDQGTKFIIHLPIEMKPA